LTIDVVQPVRNLNSVELDEFGIAVQSLFIVEMVIGLRVAIAHVADHVTALDDRASLGASRVLEVAIVGIPANIGAVAIVIDENYVAFPDHRRIELVESVHDASSGGEYRITVVGIARLLEVQRCVPEWTGTVTPAL
jgi:hypothetical protein